MRRAAGAGFALALATARMGAQPMSPQPGPRQPMPPPAALARARQLVVVVADGWDATTGTLHRYARRDVRTRWRPVGDRRPVVLGRAGLAWGVGQGDAPRRAPIKREGDGRSPAGAFPLLHTFGVGPFAPAAGRMPLVRLAPGTVCVDDPASPLYNVVADSAAAAGARWTSAERMPVVAGYRTGVVVGYNGARTTAGPVRLGTPGAAPNPGAGSCIFLHVWDGRDRPTAGCTAMAPGVAIEVATWLDPERRPVLVQMPRDVYGLVSPAWELP